MTEPNPERETHPLSDAMHVWEEVTADVEATAEEYREAGWSVTELHPGDVAPVPSRLDTVESETFGLNVIVPGEEFEAVEELAEAAAFDSYDAYGAERGGTVFLAVVLLAEEAGQAVAVPLYYETSEAAPMLERAADAGEMRIIVRSLSTERRVVFTQADPESLFPAGDDS